jgi:Cof subfamily protein (haloacid dehalogenase superfamily)
MTIKMIAVDMDGTFLRDDDQYDVQRFNQQFAKLRQLGIRFVAASGSQRQRLQSKFATVADQMDFISENGSIVYSDGQLLAVETIPQELLQQVQQLVKTDFNVPLATTVVSGVRSAYVDQQESPTIFKIKQRYYNELTRVDHILDVSSRRLDDPIVKLGIWFNADVDFAAQTKCVKQALPAKLESLASGFNTELIGLRGVNKRTGIAHLQTKYRIQDDEVMTFGDNENDVAMLEMTPYGYAMQNAHQSAKTAAHHLAPDNNRDGVLDVIDQVIADAQENEEQTA